MSTTISDELISGISGGMDSEMAEPLNESFNESLNESFNTVSDENMDIINSDTFDDSNEEKAVLKMYSSVKRFNVKSGIKISNSNDNLLKVWDNYNLY
jgi:hypothetical protein